MDSQIEAVKSALDIVSIIQSYVPSLKSRGRNHFGLCPFHQEKSPSFSVNPELQIYKCFGCGEGGDVINFIQKIEGLDFPTALELAANKAGITLEKFTSPLEQKKRAEKKRALEAHKLAAEYYHYVLLNHPSGKIGLDYATSKRKLAKKQIKEFFLGYAPRSYHNLEKFLAKKGFTQQELVAWGLLASKNGRVYDKFRERLLHPIFNMQGEVIGFSGRIINPDHPGPKYLNSPETIIYHKKSSLYGAFQAKEAIRKRRSVIIVEGNIDVISSARVGADHIVCPLGTALTSEQLKLITRYAQEILFAFDTDAAGKKALLRALELTESTGLKAKAIDLGKFKDVDEMVVADPQLWLQSIDKALEIPEFIMEIFKADFDLSSASEKVDYLEKVMPFIAKLRQEVKVDHYLQRLELITGTKYEVLTDMLNKERRELKGEAYYSGHKQTANTSEAEVAPVSEAVTALLRVPKPLQQLLNYLYYYREQLLSVDTLKTIYKQRVSKQEETLLDMALAENLREFDKPQVVALKDLFAGIVSTDSKIELNFEEPQTELEKMLKAYVRRRIQVYLQTLKQKALQTEDDGNYGERILAYTKVLKELT